MLWKQKIKIDILRLETSNDETICSYWRKVENLVSNEDQAVIKNVLTKLGNSDFSLIDASFEANHSILINFESYKKTDEAIATIELYHSL